MRNAKRHLWILLRSEKSWRQKISKAYNYLLASYRYKLYYNRYFFWLIRNHIREQIEFRIQVMDKNCYHKGECKMCGCMTTALQMSNEPCEGDCYPAMLPHDNWRQMLPLWTNIYNNRGRETYLRVVKSINGKK